MKYPIIFGIKGLVVSDEEREFFQKYPPLGFVLFSRNIDNKDQVKNLVEDLKSLSTESKILIDQEGGRVSRLKYPLFRECPQPKYFGDLYKEESKKVALDSAYRNYYNITKELLSFGINMNSVPVADLLHKGAHQIIGNRSFGSDVEIVVELCSEVIRATKDAGGIPIMKHIPGHGRATLDSHESLPFVSSNLDLLEKTDFLVFKKLAQNTDIEYAMSAHIIYSALDQGSAATVSPHVLRYIRNQIGFNGKIITDDLSMSALRGNLGFRAKKSLEAGCDILLHCNGDMAEMTDIMSSMESCIEA